MNKFIVSDILQIIADLARETASLSGGTHEGVVYTAAEWRERLEQIARRAEELQTPRWGKNF
jgi:hypothetical protein